MMSMFQALVAWNAQVIVFAFGASDKVRLIEDTNAGVARTAGLRRDAARLNLDLLSECTGYARLDLSLLDFSL